ncbi:MAG: FAD:protein FMN transferase [Lachnospiraceae bacterium]|nr:FAD:protein FMN transferase [Lachnospiraceae bacterium]
MFKSRISKTIILLSAAACTMLTGCGSLNTGKDGASRTGLYFDTTVTIQIYDENAEELLDGCFDLCDELEDILSAQESSSELYKVNHRKTSKVEISDDLADCIAMGLEAGEISDGEFDITIFPVSELWDFRSGEGRVPAEAGIKEALKHVDRTEIRLIRDEEKNTEDTGAILEINDDEAMIDPGAVAKGYISERIKEYLKDEGCKGAVINLGGNVSTLGVKPDGSDFKVGVQKPFTDRGEIETVISMGEGCVISSGTYERCFSVDGVLYHHILSAKTGHPADTGLTQVTIIGDDDMLCDTLSTVGVLLGKDRMEALTEDKGYKVKLLFTDDKGNITFFDPDSGERIVTEGETLKVSISDR